jgi:hypothetical protein
MHARYPGAPAAPMRSRCDRDAFRERFVVKTNGRRLVYTDRVDDALFNHAYARAALACSAHTENTDRDVCFASRATKSFNESIFDAVWCGR